MIKTLQKSAVLRDTNMAAATLVGAQADAMRTAAGNSAGAMTGFMGMGMATAAGGANAQGLFAMNPQPTQAPAPAPASAPADGWTCACGAVVTGKFCTECGAKRPQKQGWTCACGSVNLGKFCPECGAKKPAAAPLYRCDKCGWTPEDPKNPPKFCPECGDRFDEDDAR
jgi:membrane protease subunit (stomatin/prohibitin family)